MEKDLYVRHRVGVDDFVLLENHTSEEAFIDNLHKRYREKLIYTYIGSVLVSVNPYQDLPIYDRKYVETYGTANFYELPPHIFAVTNTALRSLCDELRDQCILISGESGAGKTEASKKVLQFIAATSRQKEKVDTVRDKLLQSNPVLEAFGNAKTNRNDNSSRFGKYMDVEFNFLGEPIGGHIINYLLEKSRVVFQANGERNFHIFYQLLAGADDSHLERLSLERNPQLYSYLKQGDSCKVSSIDDASDFQNVKNALKVMEITAEEQEALFQLVAVVMHLGNVDFIINRKGDASLTNPENVATVAKLLGCPVEILSSALTNRTIQARGDTVKTPLDIIDAVKARDALAKSLYERLFSWLVQRLNRSLAAVHHNKKTVMGILDIYGFEIFENNSFEQLCINYCNEKLQQLFIELTLRTEQDEYRREGIQWEPVAYFDNKIICDLVEEKRKGIISILNEECLRPGATSDSTFLSKMNDMLVEHPHYLSHAKVDNKTRKTIERDQFRLKHYAGEVTYDVHGFIEKNNDLLFRDLKESIIVSTNSITNDLFSTAELNSKKRPETASSQFKSSLAQLLELLVSKEPSYIRCIKPNESKLADSFDMTTVTHQVKYLGLMENLRVRRAGFAYRRPYEPFINRYKSLCPETWPFPKGTPKEAVQTLVNHLNYGPDDYRMGATKIFIRFPKTFFETEDAFQRGKNRLATIIQKIYKGRLQRRQYLKMRTACISVQTYVRRFLAKRRADRRRWAVSVVRTFIKGFMARNETASEANAKFHSFVRCQFLLRLSKALPQSVLDKSWPGAPVICEEPNEILRELYMKTMVRRYCKGMSPPRRRQFELKVMAEQIFRGNRKNYPKSIAQWFVDSRLSAEATPQFRSGFESIYKPQNEQILYSVPVIKFDRHGYKARERILCVTNSAIYLLDAKDSKIKHRLTFNTINGITVTNGMDNLILIRVPEDTTTDKGDIILECQFLIETLTRIYDASGRNQEMIHFETTSSLTHNVVKGKPGVIEISQSAGSSGIAKGKNGHLIVAASS